MKTDVDYKRPIYASLYYGLAVVVSLVTALGLVVSAMQFQRMVDPAGLILGLVGFGLAGLIIAVLLWGTGQLFDLVGKIEYNTRQNTDAEVVTLLHRIARNTLPIGNLATDEGDAAFYYYYEDEKERGPLKRADLRALLASERLSPYTRVTPEIAGVRGSPIALRDLFK